MGVWACSGTVANLVIVLGVEKKHFAREPKLDRHKTGYLLVFSHPELFFFSSRSY